jgi:hypothetical protein
MPESSLASRLQPPPTCTNHVLCSEQWQPVVDNKNEKKQIRHYHLHRASASNPSWQLPTIFALAKCQITLQSETARELICYQYAKACHLGQLTNAQVTWIEDQTASGLSAESIAMSQAKSRMRTPCSENITLHWG